MFKINEIIKRKENVIMPRSDYEYNSQYKVIGYDFDGYMHSYKLENINYKINKEKRFSKTFLISRDIINICFEVDKSYYRRKKLNKICSKLMTE